MGRTHCGTAPLLGVLGIHNPLYGAGILGLVFYIKKEEDRVFHLLLEVSTVWYQGYV